MTIRELETQYTSGVYAKRHVAIVRGEGALLWDDQGREYIDCVGGQGAANLGHANPAVAAAIAAQAQTLISLPGDVLQRSARGVDGAPDAIDRHAARVSVQLGHGSGRSGDQVCARLATRRTEIVAAMRGFHGRTFGALSATWEKKYREPFEPLVPGFRTFPTTIWKRWSKAVDRQDGGGDAGSGAGRRRRVSRHGGVSCAARRSCAASAARC